MDNIQVAETVRSSILSKDEWTAMMTHMYQIKPLPVFPT